MLIGGAIILPIKWSFDDYKKSLKDTVGEKNFDYIIKKGDTLHAIALEFYKNHRLFLVIALYNEIPADKLDIIYPGERLILPSLEEVNTLISGDKYLIWIEKYLSYYKKRSK